jgi:hypothetical protein
MRKAIRQNPYLAVGLPINQYYPLIRKKAV